jgi:hypothetical protein
MSNLHSNSKIKYESLSVNALPYPHTSAPLGVLEVPSGRMTYHKTYDAPGLVVISLWRAGPTDGAEEIDIFRDCFPTCVRGGFGKPKTMVFRSTRKHKRFI